jgi:hypothetical protein
MRNNNMSDEKAKDLRNVFAEFVPGIVYNSNDPLKLGRVRMKMFGDEDMITEWLFPLLPMLGTEHGLWMVPQESDQIVCIFINGDPNLGYYLGGFLTVEKQHSIHMGDPRRITLKHHKGHRLILYENKDMELCNDIAKLELKSDGEIRTQNSNYHESISKEGHVNVTTSGHIEIHAKGHINIHTDEKGVCTIGTGNQMGGVVTTRCRCAYTGRPHPEGSSTIIVSKD